MLGIVNSVVSAVTSTLSFGKKSIAIWGVDVDELTTLLHTIKTGEYEKKESSVFPIAESVTLGGKSFELTIPSGNEGARRGFRAYLHEYEAIIFVVDARDADLLSLSGFELEHLIKEGEVYDANMPVAVLIPRLLDSTSKIAPSSLTQKDLEDVENLVRQAKAGENPRIVERFDYRLSGTEHEGYREAIEWILQKLNA